MSHRAARIDASEEMCHHLSLQEAYAFARGFEHDDHAMAPLGPTHMRGEAPRAGQQELNTLTTTWARLQAVRRT